MLSLGMGFLIHNRKYMDCATEKHHSLLDKNIKLTGITNV